MIEIYGTLGPACSTREQLQEMFRQGMTGMRLNSNHSSLAQSREMLTAMRLAAQSAGVQPQLLLDLQGPQLRTAARPAPLHAAVDALVALVDREQEGELGQVQVPEPVVHAARVGDHILINDGRVELLVTALRPHLVRARVLRGGQIESHKNIKIAGRDLTGPTLTEQDRRNIRQAREYGVTALMQPFVRSGAELRTVRAFLRESGLSHLRIFAKIENRQGVRALSDILPEADMVVIARGDLGNDVPLWELPGVQKEIEEECRKAGKPFMVVTQMLTSMIEHPVPTRAEVSDIFNAVCDGASAVMVTNETAVGRYPADVISYLKKTADAAFAFRGGQD